MFPLMQKADVVVYNGLHLEGKMGEIFENLSVQESTVLCIEKGLDESKLLAWEADSSIHDPHIWFDVSLWKDAAKTVAKGLAQADPNGKADYEANLEAYLKELEETDAYIRSRAAELPEAQRVLVTAHDAFQYFGKAYGFEVRGLQGISTDRGSRYSRYERPGQFHCGTSDQGNFRRILACRRKPLKRYRLR